MAERTNGELAKDLVELAAWSYHSAEHGGDESDDRIHTLLREAARRLRELDGKRFYTGDQVMKHYIEGWTNDKEAESWPAYPLAIGPEESEARNTPAVLVILKTPEASDND